MSQTRSLFSKCMVLTTLTVVVLTLTDGVSLSEEREGVTTANRELDSRFTRARME